MVQRQREVEQQPIGHADAQEYQHESSRRQAVDAEERHHSPLWRGAG